MAQSSLMTLRDPRTWPKNIRWAIAWMFVMLLFAILLVVTSWSFLASTKKELARSLALESAASATLTNSDQEEADIRRLLPRLREMEAQGVLGDEQRLEWIERLRSIEVRYPGIRISYSISPQTLRPASPDPGRRRNELPSKLGVFVSEMKLDLKLMHEMDLIRIFQDLSSPSIGHFEIRECSIKRSGQSRKLEAVCVLMWSTVRQLSRDASKIDGLL